MFNKKIMSALLSIVLTFSMFSTMITVDASEVGFSGFTIDYNTMNQAPDYLKDETATLAIAQDTVMGETKNVLKISTPAHTQNTDTYMSIPLGEGVSTKNGPFSITLLMKFPDKSSQPNTNGNCRVMGFPTLGADTDNSITEDDTVFGIFEMPYHKLNLMTANEHNLYVRRLLEDNDTEFDSSKNTPDESKLGVASTEAQSFINFKDKSDYVYYRWDIDPDDKTFKTWISKDGKVWEKVYGDYNIGTDKYDGTRYSEKGLMPTGELPEVIRSLKFHERKYAGYDKQSPAAMDYYIASIDVQPLKSFIIPATQGLSYTMDYNDTTKYPAGTDLKTKGYAAYNGDVTISTDSYVNTVSGNKDFTQKNVLTWNPSAAANLAIPLDLPIDTRDGKFTYTIGFKIPVSGMYPRNFGSLGGDMSVPSGTLDPAKDAILGFSVHPASGNLLVTAADRTDGFWGFKTSANADITQSSFTTDKATSKHNIFIPESEYKQSYYSLSRGNNILAQVGFSYGMTHTYHYMKVEVDPKTETFRYYHSDSRGWKEPFKDAYMMDGNYTDGRVSRYSEPGLFPTGSLPTVVNSIKIRNALESKWNKSNTSGQNYEKSYYSIASITVDQPAIAAFDYDTEPYFVDDNKIQMSFNNSLLTDAVEGYITVLKNGTELEGCTVVTEENTITITLPETAQKFNTYTVKINGIESTRGDKFADIKDLICEYNWSLKNGTNYDAGAYAYNGGEAKSTNEGYVWTPNGTTATGRALIVPIPKIELKENPVEIAFSAKFPYTGFNLDGFPRLKDDDGNLHSFGFETATLNANGTTKSYSLQQAMARNITSKFNALPNNATNPDITNDRTTVASSGLEISIGSNGSADTVLGASKDMYDFKYVIDPVSKTYRYYYKKNGTNDWIEPYKNYPSYPIAFFDSDDNNTKNKNETMPSAIEELQFFSTTQANVSPSFVFDNITVRELPAYTGVKSAVTNRNYTFVAKPNPENGKTGGLESATADVTVKIVNYEDTNIVDAKLFLAVYDAYGRLEEVKDFTMTLLPGINTHTFTGINATDSAQTDGDKKTYIYSDANVYKLFVWDGTENITPVTINVPEF